MGSKAKLRGHLSADLQHGETIEVITVAQLKQGMKQHLGKNLAAGVAAGLVTTAVTGGGSLFVYASIPAVWVVVTSQRVLMYAKTGSASKPGEMVFAAPRQALGAEAKSGLLTQVVIADRDDGRSLVRLNLGLRRKAANRIVLSIGG
ncbi:hypothetical protein [Actinomadura litoris]|uniref:Uncharacterized protein n=1 Tax=Actinomadura litoris TaxID=2678616 RepID=A0A7K1KU77_9ACTN|nr:hypothetical protein [Actinomadura litoris]MUN35557.1 hypothetical protein [Actinomadura litoris]